MYKRQEVGDIDWQRMLDDLASVPGNFTKENLQHDIDTVSYTHLDVYKRQTPPCTQSVHTEEERHETSARYSLIRGPVSYTHLDVYKRQI